MNKETKNCRKPGKKLQLQFKGNDLFLIGLQPTFIRKIEKEFTLLSDPKEKGIRIKPCDYWHLKEWLERNHFEYNSIDDQNFSLKSEFNILFKLRKYQKDAIDEGKVRSIHDQIKLIKSQMEDHRLEGILEIRQILTAEQYKKFQETMKRHKGKRKGMHKRGRGQMPGGFGMHHEGPMDGE